MTKKEQLDLLGLGAEPTRPVEDPALAHLAAKLPSHVRFGTSTWTFPGWKGIVYEGATDGESLKVAGLRAYAAHPLLRVVGLDRAHYGPIPAEELAAYAAELPPGFQVLSKVWDEVTTYTFPDHPRAGARAGQKNPRFLDPGVVTNEILPAYAAAFADFTGPFLFELPRIPSVTQAERSDIFAALDRLLDALPDRFSYAFELRTPHLLEPRYLDILRAHRAAHVLNFWTGMPDLGAQMSVPGVLTAPFVIARVMIPPRVRYEDARISFEPFNRMVTPQPTMRRDVAALSARCANEERTLTVLVGNQAEGCAPLTVRALAEAIVQSRRSTMASTR